MVLVAHILGILAATLGVCWLFGWIFSMVKELYLEFKAENTERREKR